MIKLTEKYYVDFDAMNIMLKRAKVAKEGAKNPGEITYDVDGYFGSFTSLFNSLTRKSLLEEVDKLTSLVETEEKLQKHYNEIVDNLLQSKLINTKPYKYEIKD